MLSRVPLVASASAVKRIVFASVLATAVVGTGGVLFLAAISPAPTSTAPGTTIGGLPAGNLNRQALSDLLVHATAQAPSKVAFTLGTRRITLGSTDLGLDLDVPATVEKALSESGVHRRWGLPDHVRGRDVSPVLARDRTEFDRSVARLKAAAELPESHGGLLYVEGEVRVTPPRDGQSTATSSVIRALTAAVVRLPWPDAIDVPVQEQAAHTSVADLVPLAVSARGLLASPVTLRAGDQTTVVTAAMLGPEFTVAAVDDQPGHAVVLAVKPSARTGLAARAAAALSIAPVEPRVAAPPATPVLREQGDVTWTPTRARTTLVAKGRPGQSVTAEAVLQSLSELVRGGVSVPTLDVPSRVRPATITDEAAGAIDATVGTFTTPFACCPPRVKNIALMARTIDGTLIGPGQTFSLNGIVGERTSAKGYVEAPFILDGELSTDIGGGVSQVATTTFNAALFAGMQLDRHRAHSFYIGRYPAGREATINYPSIDLRWTNTTTAAVLLRASSTTSSVTITLYGRNDGRTVQVTTGPRVDVPSKDFRITVTRLMTVPGQPARREQFTTTYNKPPAGE